MTQNKMTAIRRICADLALPEGDLHSQDWAYELPEKFRSESDLFRYLEAYDNPEYADTEKRLLVDLTLDIANDLLVQNEDAAGRAWNRLADILRARPNLHRDQVEYWAIQGEPLEDAFALTPLVRALWVELYS